VLYLDYEDLYCYCLVGLVWFHSILWQFNG
jgi:hypothetical protein